MKKLATFGIMPASNATTRFSDRVENYVLYRPGYPPETLEALKMECGLDASHIIADIASEPGFELVCCSKTAISFMELSRTQKCDLPGERWLADYPMLKEHSGHSRGDNVARAVV